MLTFEACVSAAGPAPVLEVRVVNRRLVCETAAGHFTIDVNRFVSQRERFMLHRIPALQL